MQFKREFSRPPRIDVGDQIYHVINRANGRATIFHTETDYRGFKSLLFEITETYGMRILAYVIMPNHWHLLLYPVNDKDLSKSLQWLGTTHARRHHARKQTTGNGHLYQGRYKSFLVQNDVHLLTVLKYIERNPVRAGLVTKAEVWKWGSAFERINGVLKGKKLLGESPVDLPKQYLHWINQIEAAEELKLVRRSVNTGMQYIGPLKEGLKLNAMSY